MQLQAAIDSLQFLEFRLLYAMAGNEVTGRNFLQFGVLAGFAAGLADITALQEAALVRQIHRRGDLALDQLALLLLAGNNRLGNGRQQRLGVRMQGVGKQLVGGSFFHHFVKAVSCILVPPERESASALKQPLPTGMSLVSAGLPS